MSRDGYEIRRIPVERLPQIELLRVFSRRAAMHGIFEADVTEARRLLRDGRQQLSFTAFLVGCLARAVDEHREVQSLRRGRRLILFDAVDVATMVEVDVGGARAPVFHVVRDAAAKSVRDIHDEIRAVQTTTAEVDRLHRQIRRARWVPRPFRSLMWRALGRAPHTWRRHGGTVVLSSIGMFGNGAGWGLSSPGGYPLSLIVGGIAERPALVGERLEAREHLSLTLTLDHDVVDGAPAARFGARFKELVECGHGLADAPDAGSRPRGRVSWGKAAARLEGSTVPTDIDRDEVRRLIERGGQVVEVLPREEYEEQHLPGAVHMGLRQIEEAPDRLDRERPVIVYCWDTA